MIWVLLYTLGLCALSGETDGCVFCGLRFKMIQNRFTELCEEYKSKYRTPNCSKYTTSSHFNAFGLEEDKVTLVTERVHRVFRIFELNETVGDLPKFWNWIFESKLPEYTREVLCPPHCKGGAEAVNCTTCEKKKLDCWTYKKCYPDRLDLAETLLVIAYCSAGFICLGLITCGFEYRKYK